MESPHIQHKKSEWFAIKVRQDTRAEKELATRCDEILYPKEITKDSKKKTKSRAIIPHVLFIKTDRHNALAMERDGRDHPELSVPFWIYRYPKDNQIQVIPESSIELLRLLTTDDSTRCEIFTKKEFKEGQPVRVMGGQFQGYEGYVVRVKKNKHVVVKIEGVCLVLLPFIHPDLLDPLD